MRRQGWIKHCDCCQCERVRKKRALKGGQELERRIFLLPPLTLSLSLLESLVEKIREREMGKSRRLAAAATPLLLLVLLSHQLGCVVSFNRFTVGDEKGWMPGVNYTIWEKKHRPFHVGDWLVFYYQTKTADVVRVDEDGYDKCDASTPISNYSKGRSYAFELNHTGHFYFICSFGYCYQGMKLSILVEPLTPPSSPISSGGKKSSSSAAAGPPRALGSAAAALAVSVLAAAALLRLL